MKADIDTMTGGTGFADKKVIAELTAKMLLEVEAVRFMADKPFIFTSGWASPVYTDCRRLISFPRVRRQLIEFAPRHTPVRGRVRAVRWRRRRRNGRHTVCRLDGRPADAADAIRAQEAERLRPQRADRGSPRARRARAPGRGHDHATAAARSISAMRCARPERASSTASWFFFYDIFPRGRKILSDLGVTLHALATWWDVLEVAKQSGSLRQKLAEVEKFMHDPGGLVKAQRCRAWRRNEQPRMKRSTYGASDGEFEGGCDRGRRRQRRVLRGARGAGAGRLGGDAGSGAGGGIGRQQPLHRRLDPRRL